MEEEKFGSIFTRHLAIAIPWGIIFLCLFLVISIGIKQQVKEGIQYAIRTSIKETAYLASSYNAVVPVKKNVKEGVEFLAKTVRSEIKNFINDPQVKQDIKEALEFGSEKFQK